MIKGIIITILTGILVGLILLWIEYTYFIPIFAEEEISLLQKDKPNPCPCTPGKIFHDTFLKQDDLSPEMVVIPEGEFRMGDIQGTGTKSEQPIHDIFMRRFAISRHEITFAEYDRFVKVTGAKSPNDAGWGRGNHPVINVSWKEATIYTEWLSRETGKEYRLPTEAEWEYAARAETDTNYWWGNDIGQNLANCANCDSYWSNRKTAPVGSFPANLFKLYDTVGNVYEWTCSEYEQKYTGREQRCLSKYNTTALRTIRGGSWYSNSRFARATNRYRYSWNYRDNNIGFRVVRLIFEQSATD